MQLIRYWLRSKRCILELKCTIAEQQQTPLCSAPTPYTKERCITVNQMIQLGYCVHIDNIGWDGGVSQPLNAHFLQWSFSFSCIGFCRRWRQSMKTQNCPTSLIWFHVNHGLRPTERLFPLYLPTYTHNLIHTYVPTHVTSWNIMYCRSFAGYTSVRVDVNAFHSMRSLNEASHDLKSIRRMRFNVSHYF